MGVACPMAVFVYYISLSGGVYDTKLYNTHLYLNVFKKLSILLKLNCLLLKCILLFLIKFCQTRSQYLSMYFDVFH